MIGLRGHVNDVIPMMDLSDNESNVVRISDIY